jgi:hypothetical protein
MSEQKPDRWEVVEITDGKTSERKVFASWGGGYLHGDSWKLSSGITKIVEHADHYEFHNHSGSVYLCGKNSHGMTGYTSSVYSSWEEKMKEVPGASIRVLEDKEIEASK